MTEVPINPKTGKPKQKRRYNTPRFKSHNHTEEYKKKVSETQKKNMENGTNFYAIKTKCPHCTWTGQYANALRYHFDNCKAKWDGYSTKLNKGKPNGPANVS